MLTPSDPAVGDYFGQSVAMDGDIILVGTWTPDWTTVTSSVYVFQRDSDGVWREKAKLKPSDSHVNDEFGWSVALQGTRAVVGAPFNNGAGYHAGAAYVFELACPPPACPGDLNTDGIVDLLDLSTQLSNYGSTSASAEMGDLDADSDVDLQDLSTLLPNYGTNCP